MRRPTMTVYQDDTGSWRWRLRGANGAKVASSGESFASRGNALRAAKRVVELCRADIEVGER